MEEGCDLGGGHREFSEVRILFHNLTVEVVTQTYICGKVMEPRKEKAAFLYDFFKNYFTRDMNSALIISRYFSENCCQPGLN